MENLIVDLGVAGVGIGTIMAGGKDYEKLAWLKQEGKSREVTDPVFARAAGKTLLGAGALTALSLGNENMIFGVPQMAATVNAGATYCSVKFEKISDFMDSVKGKVGAVLMPVVAGGVTGFEYAEGVLDWMNIAALTSLAVAFALGGRMDESKNRMLRILGGATLVGSAGFQAGAEIVAGNLKEALVPGTYTALNIAFLVGEVRSLKVLKEADGFGVDVAVGGEDVGSEEV